MKNIINKNKLLILFSILSLAGCSDYIELENKNEISQEDFYRDETELNLGINGAYNTLRAPIAYEWMISEIRSDNAFMNNTGTTNAQNLQVYNNDVFEAPTFDFFIESYWFTSYQSIKTVNALLAGLKTSYNATTGTIVYNDYPYAVSDQIRKRIAGEASFMRAYHYFNLVRSFGGVFLLDKVIGPDAALKLPRASEADIYKFIIADLKNASANCISAPFAGISATDKGKVTSWAAKSLLAKVYLTLGQKSDAVPLLTDVIANSGHSILTGATGYSNVFSSTNELNAEILFAIRFKSGGLGGGSSLANLFSPNATAVSTQTGLAVPTGTRGAYNNPTEEFYNSYAATDVRRNYNIKVYKPTPTSATTQWTYWTGKHNAAVAVANDSELDWPVLRFTDVVLMLAEAQGNIDDSRLQINKVRLRTGLLPLTTTDVNTTAKFELALANERRWEFAFENQRWFDILRFNKTMTTITAKGVMDNHFTLMEPFYALYDVKFTLEQLKNHTTDPKFNLLPIPNIEIITNTVTKINQNPGYN